MILLILSTIVLGIFCLCLAWQIRKLSATNKIAMRKVHDIETATTCLYEFLSRRACHIHSNQEHHILCLGNSITFHPYKAEMEWFSEHGMAASSPEKDYCHILESKLKVLNNKSTVTGINIAELERGGGGIYILFSSQQYH